MTQQPLQTCYTGYEKAGKKIAELTKGTVLPNLFSG